MADTKYKYDLILNYSRNDIKAVEKVARCLSDKGLNLWFDRWSLVPGAVWKSALKETLENSFAMAVFIGFLPLSSFQQKDVQFFFEEKMSDTVRRIIPVLLPGSTLDNVSSELRNLDTVDLRGGLENSYELDRLANMVRYKDVAGANGEFITRFSIEKPTGQDLIELMTFLDKKRQESSNQEIINAYNPSVLPDYPPKLRESVTENRVEELNQAMVYLQDHRILFVSGVGGVGKTTLARALIDLRPANVPLPFWYDFGKKMDAGLGDILEKLANYMDTQDIAHFKDEGRDAEQNDINRFIGELQLRGPIWLVFDNLDTILEGKYFQDPVVELLFTSLKHSTHQAKIIITSRTLPILRNGEILIDLEEEKQELKGLKIDSAIDYLKKNGLAEAQEEKLKEIAKYVDGHPLALKLLIGLVKKFGMTDTLNNLSIYLNRKEDVIKKVRRIFDKVAGDEIEILERISVFRQHVPINAIKKLFTDMTSENSIKNLLDKSLLETYNESSYWLHPLIRKFAYDDLENKNDVHRLAYEYYISLPLLEKRTKKEDVQSLIEAHYHACMAKEYDNAVNIIFDNNLDEDLFVWGNYKILAELYTGVLPKDHFKDQPLLSDIHIHNKVLGNLGIAYHYTNMVDKAINYYKKALEISIEIGNKRNEEAWLGSLGNAFSDLGQFEKAIEYYQKALIVAEEIGDQRGKSNRLGNLGLAYSYMGQIENSIEYHKQALVIAREIGDRRGEGADLGNLGIAYKNLGQVEKAIEYFEQALVIAREIEDRRGEGNHLGNLGNAYRDLGQVEKAIKYYEQALVIDLEIGDRRGEGADLGNLGIAYSDLGQVEEAIEYYEQALVIAREIGDRGGEGNRLGNLGNAYSDLGQVEEAIKYYEQALVIDLEIGDRGGEGADLGNLGNAYRDLGQVEKAIEYYEQALVIAREIGDRRGEEADFGNLGIAYSDLGQVEKGIEYFEQALVIAREIGDRGGEGKHLGNLGIAYYYLGQVEKAIEYHEQALVISRGIGYRLLESASLINMGDTFVYQNEWTKAIKLYNRAREIADEIGYIQIQNESRSGLARAHLHSGDLEAARSIAESAFKYDYPMNNHNVFALLGVIALRQGDSASAKNAFKAAVEASDALLGHNKQNYDALDAKGLALCGLALCDEDTNYIPDAISSYEAARSITRAPGTVRRVLRLFDELAKADTQGLISGVREAAGGK
jgi:tetratricopeptide (TPR) repeat protein